MTDVIDRCIASEVVQLRAAPEGSRSPGTLLGYGAVFNQSSRDLGGWFEEIDPGAFGAPGPDGALDLTLHTRVICRSEHDSRLLLGTSDAGTLRLFLDDVGLRYEVDLPDTGAGRDAAVLADRGDYRYSSFAFRTLEVEWREGSNDELIRRVKSAKLVDVAPVADPAYWGASVGKRDFNLDEIRADLHKDDQPAPPGDWENDAATRARSINDGIEARQAALSRRKSRIGGKKGASDGIRR